MRKSSPTLMRKEKVVVRILPTSKKPRESKQRMKKRKSQKRRKVGLGWARTWVLSPRLWRMVNLCRALGGGTASFPLGFFLSSLGLSVAPRSGRAHKRMKLDSPSLCWLIEPCQAPEPGACLGSLWSGAWFSHTTQALFLALHPFPRGLPPPTRFRL